VAHPVASPSPWPVFEHYLVSYRRTWRGSVFSSFLLPLLFLFGMGVSLGSYVDTAGRLGVPYLDYIAPGLLASTALQVVMGETMYPVLGGFEWRRTFFGMQASPLRASDMVGGTTMFALTRTGTSALGYMIAMGVFGTLHSWWSVALLPACLLLAASLAGFTIAFSASITTDNMFALLNRFAVLPMTLFAGVFFPVAQMPAVLRWVAYVTPLWHGVELCRAAALGTATAAPIWLHIGYLAALTTVGYWLAGRRFARRLGK
jgi:lipooligosaccharide transport system permease protein